MAWDFTWSSPSLFPVKLYKAGGDKRMIVLRGGYLG